MTDTTHPPVSLEGTVVKRPVLDGTRSERVLPVLLVGEGTDGEKSHRIHVVGDDPFTEPTLSGLINCQVRVTGTWRNGVLRVGQNDVVPAVHSEEGRTEEPNE